MKSHHHSLVFAVPRRCIEKGCKRTAALGMWRCKEHLNPPKVKRRVKKDAPDSENSNFVYFLRGENGLIKIGRTSGKPEKRMSEIQNMSPTKLELLASFPCHPKMEPLLHKMFAHRRKHGEWFESCDKFEGLIEAVKNGDRFMMEFHLSRKDADYGPEYVDIGVTPEYRDSNVVRDKIREYITEFDRY